MEFGIVANAPLVFWFVFAAFLVVPYRFPGVGLGLAALATALGIMMCRNMNDDAFAQHIARELGTAIVICAGIWLVTACVSLIARAVREDGETWMSCTSRERLARERCRNEG